MDDYLATISISVNLLLSKHEAEGEMSFDQEVTEGYMHDVSLNTKFSAKASMETGELEALAAGKVSAEVAAEITAGYAFNFNSTTTTKRSLKMPAGSPGYIYQFTSNGTTTSGVPLEWAGGLMMTTSPFEIRESKSLLKTDTIYWLNDTKIMTDRGDDGNVSFDGWDDLLQKAKDNLKPGMGAVADWHSGDRGTLYIKRGIPEMSRHADLVSGVGGCTTFWVDPALEDKIKVAADQGNIHRFGSDKM